MIKIIDDFLEPSSAHYVQDQLFRKDWPWFFQDIIDYDGDSDYVDRHQFVYPMYLRHSWVAAGETIVNHFLPRLDPLTLVRVKANLLVRTETVRQNTFHIDINNQDGKTYPNLLTSIYYVNSNDGYTLFEEGTKVESVANRMVIFPSHMRHTGTTCTNAKRRVVINFNYFPITVP